METRNGWRIKAPKCNRRSPGITRWRDDDLALRRRELTTAMLHEAPRVVNAAEASRDHWQPPRGEGCRSRRCIAPPSGGFDGAFPPVEGPELDALFAPPLPSGEGCEAERFPLATVRPVASGKVGHMSVELSDAEREESQDFLRASASAFAFWDSEADVAWDLRWSPRDAGGEP